MFKCKKKFGLFLHLLFYGDKGHFKLPFSLIQAFFPVPVFCQGPRLLQAFFLFSWIGDGIVPALSFFPLLPAWLHFFFRLP